MHLGQLQMETTFSALLMSGCGDGPDSLRGRGCGTALQLQVNPWVAFASGSVAQHSSKQ